MGKNHVTDERMAYVLTYIQTHCREKISLSGLAAGMGMSASALSGLFKKKTGMGFVDYVNQVRIEHIARELFYSDVTAAAARYGFTNMSVFFKLFKERYGMTPAQYRGCMGKQMISCDCAQKKADKRMWDLVINIGPLSSLLGASLQRQTVHMRDHLGFTFVRVWDVFSRSLAITDGRTMGYYNYDNLNLIFDFCVEHQIRPYLVFGKRPCTGDMAGPLDDRILFDSEAAWLDMLENFICHIQKRYSKAEVEQWIFEFVWDTRGLENPYYKGAADYFAVFFAARRLVKRYLPQAVVGGICAVPGRDDSFLKAFICQCRQRECLPDFLSFSLYEDYPGGDSRYCGGDGSEFNSISGVQHMRQLWDDLGLEKCRLFVSEWNLTVSDSSIVNDSCYRGAYMAWCISMLWNQMDMLGFWKASDWTGGEARRGVVHGGAGLMTKSDIRKPAYYTLWFLNRLGDTVWYHGNNAIVTGNGCDDFYILLFHLCRYNALKESNSGAVPVSEMLDNCFEFLEPETVELVFNHADPGNYKIKRHQVNKSCGNILDEWKQFLYDDGLEDSDIMYLRDRCMPTLSMECCSTDNGNIKIRTVLQSPEICFLHIYKDNVENLYI